jgi:AraC-like DNA-binding protein
MICLQETTTTLLCIAEKRKKRMTTSDWEHPAVKQTKVYLEEHYAEEISLEDLARVASLSPFHLSRIFRQSVGVPPHVYQTHIRLAHAKTLLAQGFEIGDVASATGFFDQAHFTNQFKRYVSVTPGYYRKTARFSKTMALVPVTIALAVTRIARTLPEEVPGAKNNQ